MIHTPYATRGMVVAPHHVAAQAGLAILREGGNAVEAAVATAAALCVVYPHMTGLGGDGFWLIAEPGRAPVAIDACGRSARAATPELFHKAGLSAIPWRGPLAAITVAGAVSGWAEALQLAQGFGGKALPLSRLLEDARYLARNGMVVTRSQATLTAAKLAELAPQPGFAAQFLALDQPPNPGTRLTLPALADTLDRLAQAGLGDFYHGEVAQALAHDLTHVGSPLRAEDLAAQRALVTTPLRCSLPGVNLYNLPPPTQGLASLMMLGIFSRLKVRHAESFEHLHGLIEAAKLAFAVRDRIIGDPDCMTESPAPYVTDQILDDLAGRIAMDQAAPTLQREADAGDTVWFGVIDANGRAVSCIQSIFFEFGSGVVLPETGVTWQNRGIAFQLTKGRPRSLEPGRKPYHTLNPAMARFADGRTMVYGTMGGEGQPQTQAALFTRYALYGKGLQAAITAPRWVQGRTWGGETVSLKMEDRFDPDLVDHLRRVGHRVEVVEPFAHMMGHAGAIVRHPDHLMEGGADPRGDGVVACW